MFNCYNKEWGKQYSYNNSQVYVNKLGRCVEGIYFTNQHAITYSSYNVEKAISAVDFLRDNGIIFAPTFRRNNTKLTINKENKTMKMENTAKLWYGNESVKHTKNYDTKTVEAIKADELQVDIVKLADKYNVCLDRFIGYEEIFTNETRMALAKIEQEYYDNHDNLKQKYDNLKTELADCETRAEALEILVKYNVKIEVVDLED